MILDQKAVEEFDFLQKPQVPVISYQDVDNMSLNDKLLDLIYDNKCVIYDVYFPSLFFGMYFLITKDIQHDKKSSSMVTDEKSKPIPSPLTEEKEKPKSIPSPLTEEKEKLKPILPPHTEEKEKIINSSSVAKSSSSMINSIQEEEVGDSESFESKTEEKKESKEEFIVTQVRRSIWLASCDILSPRKLFIVC
ncbi:hypothetical protein ACFE04_021802 [Oxalis oulophora]